MVVLRQAVFLAAVGAAWAMPAAEPEPDLGSLLDQLKESLEGIAEDIIKNDDDTPGQIAQADLDNALYFAEYAEAAYCAPNHVVGTEVVCKDDLCPEITANTVTTIAEFDMNLEDTTGIVALDETRQSIVVAYRGSSSFLNWIANLQIEFEDASIWCDNCNSHYGFYHAYIDESEIVRATVANLSSAYPDYDIVTAGHSLGGALAQIAAVDLRVLGYKVTAYTYGSPRFGNDELSQFATDSGTNFRFTHLDDPVPKIPTISMGFSHVSPEYHVFQGDSGITVTDIKGWQGLTNYNGNTGTDVSLNIDAHLHYLLEPEISACGGD